MSEFDFLSKDGTYGFKKHEGVYRYHSKFGKSSGYIDCPFCDSTVEVYVWSLAGSGKKCHTCGAILGGRTASMKISK